MRLCSAASIQKTTKLFCNGHRRKFWEGFKILEALITLPAMKTYTLYPVHLNPNVPVPVRVVVWSRQCPSHSLPRLQKLPLWPLFDSYRLWWYSRRGAQLKNPPLSCVKKPRPRRRCCQSLATRTDPQYRVVQRLFDDPQPMHKCNKLNPYGDELLHNIYICTQPYLQNSNTNLWLCSFRLCA